MQHAKRIVSMVLALLMVLGTVGWIFSMVASAASGTYSLIEIRDIGGYQTYIKGDEKKNDKTIKPGFTVSMSVTYSANFPTEAAAQELLNVAQDQLVFYLSGGDFEAASKDHSISLTKVLSSAPEPVNGGDGGYNIRYQIEVRNVVYDGGSGMSLAIALRDASGATAYDETAKLSIGNCIPTPERTPSSGNDDDGDDDDFIDAATPYVIISDFDYGGSQISAGDTFTLNLTIKNTALHIDVSNMVITVTPSESFTLVNSSNTFYVSGLSNKGVINRSLQMQAKPSADPSAASIEIKLSYQYIDKTRKTVDRSESISIPVVQQERFSVSPPEDVATEIYVGEEADLSLDYMNKGRGTIYNVSASIQGENLQTPGQTDNVGNVEPGKSGTFDFYVAGIEPGVVSGEVVVTYEDINMNVKTISVPFSIKVNGMEMEAGGDMMGYVDENGNTVMPDGTVLGPDGMPIDPNASQGNSTLLFIGIGAGVLVAIIIVIVVAKKKRKARLEAELAEDEDEDN